MADDDQQQTSEQEPPAAPTPEENTGKVFTQEDVNRIMGETREQARKAVANEVASTLGVGVDEAKAIIGRHQEAEKAAMTEAERAAAEAQEREAAASVREQEAARKVLSADVTLALIGAGITDKTVRNEAAVLVMAKLDPSGEITDDSIAAAVEQVKSSVPSLFSDPKPPSGEPTRATPPGRVASTSTAAERGRERARAMQGRTSVDN